MDQLKILSNFSFGRVDAETDDRLVNCFVGTELLKHALIPQHTLLLGGKGSGKSAIFRILSQEADRLNQILNNSLRELIRIPAYGLHSDEYLTHAEIRDVNPNTTDDFKYFWQLYFCLKTSYYIINSNYLTKYINKSNSAKLKSNYDYLVKLLDDVGLIKLQSQKSKTLVKRLKELLSLNFTTKNYTSSEKAKLNVNLIFDKIDQILKETNSYAWILVDQIDVLYLDDLNKRNKAITALIQLMIEYGNRYSNINLKIFLRTDIYKELNIVNKSHLVSYIIELIWTDDLIMRLLLARAIYDRNVKQYCEEKLRENLDINKIITGNYQFLLKVFYAIFQDNSKNKDSKLYNWMIKKLSDGMGKIYPREFIHLANTAVQVEKEIIKNQMGEKDYLISEKAIKTAYKSVSNYRCETYLYAEFPHLLKHFKKLTEFGQYRITKDDLLKLFEDCEPKGIDALRAIYDTGLLKPLYNHNPENSKVFVVPDLYRYGLGLVNQNKNSKISKAYEVQK